MFGLPSTPISQTRAGTWPRYMGGQVGTESSSSSSPFPTLHQDVFTTPTQTSTRLGLTQQSLSRSVPSSSHSSHSSSNPLSPTYSHSSPPSVETLQTPFVGRSYTDDNNNNSDIGNFPETPTQRSYHHQHPVSHHRSFSTPTAATFAQIDIRSSPTIPIIPGVMPAYPDTPSPPPHYGLHGTTLLPAGQTMIQSNTACQDPFIMHGQKSINNTRAVLRPTSHNGVYHQQPPSNWSNERRTPLMPTTTTVSASGTADKSRPSTSASIPIAPSAATTTYTQGLATSAPLPSTSQQQQHEASAPSSTSFATLSSSAPAYPSSHPLHPQPSTTQTSSSGHQSQSQQPPYNDDLAYHTASYPGSAATSSTAYESNFSASAPNTGGSPWITGHNPLPSPHLSQSLPGQPTPYYGGYPSYHPHHPHPQSMYGMYPPTHQGQKEIEPILAPGEVPAPRPPMSYAALIGEALLLAPPPHQLYVSEISESIKRRYAYYRQNPTKIYNGVRHQTSMCKAFVKLPRPFGDQSGGARKWAIRAGCETWFQGGGYHPPGTMASPPLSHSSLKSKSGSMGKAKATARSKQLAIGTASPVERRSIPAPSYEEPWSAGPSSGPAYDGSDRPYVSYAHGGMSAPAPPQSSAQNHQAYHNQQYSQSLPPGYHYVPVPAAYAHMMQGYPPSHNNGYAPVWGPYGAPPPPAAHANQHAQEGDADGSSPELDTAPHGWNAGSDELHGSSEHDHASQESHSPRSVHSAHGASP